MSTTNDPTPTGLILICNDLGEVEQVIQDGLGLAALDDAKQGKAVFLRLVERSSLEKARAFLTDLRINHKVTDRELSLQTKEGPLSALVAGVKAGGQFVIIAAITPADRDKLFAGALAHAAQEQARVVTRPPRPRPVKAEAKQPPAPEKPATKIETVRAELERARQDFYELALVDSLTGLYNRRHFVKRLKEELREAERYQRSPALLLLDIDDFTAINEQFGLHAGDEILRSVGEVIQGVLRKVDIIGRLGGDEFGALLLETTPQSSLLAAHRLQKHLSGVAIEVDERLFHIKVSIALVHAGDDKAVSADTLLRQAEKLLQQAKESGGNLVIQA